MSRESQRDDLAVLNSPVLTPKVWMELFDIWQMHISTDLPFLHRPTFLEPLHQSTAQSPQLSTKRPSEEPTPSSPTPGAAPVVLLGFLTLTAKFHPELVAHLSTSAATDSSNPWSASEYYASFAKSYVSKSWGSRSRVPTIERTQAWLMLGFHEWGMCRGFQAWLLIGNAVRTAQAMGLQYEQDLDDGPLARSLAMAGGARFDEFDMDRKNMKPSDQENAFVSEEIRRRTFWSCFIMDRYVSSGKYRPQIFHVEDLRVQLPSSERAFIWGEKVRTLLLGEALGQSAGRVQLQRQRQESIIGSTDGVNSQDFFQQAKRAHVGTYEGDQVQPIQRNGPLQDSKDTIRWELGSDEGVISRCVKVIEIYGRVVKWSCNGGRRTERYPPWNERSAWHALNSLLANFYSALPADLNHTHSNLSAHISSRGSTTPFILIHMVYLLCKIMLHREYLPWVPLRCSKPVGPLDPPIIPANPVPETFWEDSARECFQAARQLIDLARTSQLCDVLVESPIVGFAIYTGAHIGVYSMNFPWMDTDGYMCSDQVNSGKMSVQQAISSQECQNERTGMEATRLALEIIGQMRQRLKMADGWFRTIKRMHKYFVCIKEDYRHSTLAMAGSGSLDGVGRKLSIHQLGVREGGQGGGLEEYQLVEKTLNEFGSLNEDSETSNTLDVDGGIDIDNASGVNSVIHTSEVQETATDSAVHAPATDEEDDKGGALNAARNVAATEPVSIKSHGSSPRSTLPPNRETTKDHDENDNPMLFEPSRAHHISINAARPHPANQSDSQDTSQQELFQSLPQDHQPFLEMPQRYQPSPCIAAWGSGTKETWLDHLNTRLGGDDIAAFVDGDVWEDWGQMAGQESGAFVGGWLSTLWGGAGDDGNQAGGLGQ